MSPPIELRLVHSPDRPLDVLHPTEALVEREVVPHSVLKGNKGWNISVAVLDLSDHQLSFLVIRNIGVMVL